MLSLDGAGPVRTLVVDDDRVFTEALVEQLGADGRIEVIGQARTGEEALALVEELRPQLVLMDLAMPGMAGLAATRRIRNAHPETVVLVLTGSTAGEDVRSASEAGAAGFLTKDSLASEVASAILGLASFAGAERG